MARIGLRHIPREPLNSKEPKVQRWLSTAANLAKQGKLTKHYKEEPIRARLLLMFSNNCAYCESYIEQGDVDHFRPKAAVKDLPKHLGYFWLAHEWSNLYWSCPCCNQAAKRDYFPLERESSRCYGPEDDLSQEEPLLLDPCRDRPEEHLQLEPNGSLSALTHKGRISIQIYRLQRSRLREARKAKIEQLLAWQPSPEKTEPPLSPSTDMFTGLLLDFYRRNFSLWLEP
jgi:uncharacterized protein (TIGR02646 family)